MEKPNLVLIPGLLSNQHLWKHQINELNKQAKVMVIPVRQNTVEKMIQHVLSTAPETFCLAGHSIGGRIAMEIALTAPERITKLCLLNTTCHLDPPEKSQFRKQMIERCKNGMFNEIIDELTEIFIFQKSLRDEVKTMFLEEGVETFINQENAMLSRGDCCPLLPKINCPTLVIHAKQDALFSHAQNKELADLIPKAEFAIVPESGHMSPMENPSAVTTLMRQWIGTSHN